MAVDPWSLEGLLNFLKTGTYDPASGAHSVEEYIAKWIANGGASKLAGALTSPLPADFLDKPWPEAMTRAILKTGTSEDVAPAVRSWVGDQAGVVIGTLVAYLRDKLEELNTKYPDLYNSLFEGADKIIDFLVTEVTGLTIADGTVSTALLSTNKDALRQSLGNVFVTLLDETLKLDDAAQGFIDRNTGPAEAANMARLVGAAFRMQLGDMVAGWIAGILPFGLGDGATEIAERIDKAINLDDAIEEIIQVPMEATVTKGLTQYYNRKLKPTDMTDNEARQAYIAGRIGTSDYNKILDNTGVRDDIRDILLDFTAANLTESDINEAYQRNLLSIEQVKDQYKQKYFQEPERQIKTDLVKGTRRWTLQTKVVELLGNLYRDGVQTKDACTPYLNALGYENDEQELWFLMQDLERQQRKWITDNQLLKLLDSGQVTMTFAHDYLVMQGMVSNDAWILIANHFKEEAVAKLPKEVKNKCLDILDPTKVLVEVLGELAQLANFGTLFDSRAQQFYRCLIEELGKTLGTP